MIFFAAGTIVPSNVPIKWVAKKVKQRREPGVSQARVKWDKKEKRNGKRLKVEMKKRETDTKCECFEKDNKEWDRKAEREIGKRGNRRGRTDRQQTNRQREPKRKYENERKKKQERDKA